MEKKRVVQDIETFLKFKMCLFSKVFEKIKDKYTPYLSIPSYNIRQDGARWVKILFCYTKKEKKGRKKNRL